MSGHGGGSAKGSVTRVVQVLALVVVFGLLYWATRFQPSLESRLELVAAVGFLLLGGTLLSELLEPLGLPHLSGYLLAGIIGGPYVLELVDHHTVEKLSPINTLSLALIALSGGASSASARSGRSRAASAGQAIRTSQSSPGRSVTA
jgi:hypothetical protein